MDRRQRKTRRAIFGAFEELVAETTYAQLTVAQIIERADIGRSTFYAHFSSKEELLDSMCDEMFAHVFDGVETSPHVHEGIHQSSLEGTLSHLLSHLRDSHHGICAKLLAEGEPHFKDQFCERLRAFFSPQLPERSSWVPKDLMSALVVSSFCETVSWWHGKGFEASPDELAHWYARTLGWQVRSRR